MVSRLSRDVCQLTSWKDGDSWWKFLPKKYLEDMNSIYPQNSGINSEVEKYCEKWECGLGMN